MTSHSTFSRILGASLPLLVNNKLVPDSRVGQKAVMSSRSVGAWEYVAVKLKPGENQLEVRQLDPFGNVRGSQSITIIAPGNLGKLSLTVPTTGTPSGALSHRKFERKQNKFN